MIGIYCIKCLINKKVYIGSSINIESRIIHHKNCLKRNKHSNFHLQNSWNKYGEENFKFSVIEICNKENLLEKENFYIKKNNSLKTNKGFNLVIAERKDDLYCNKEYLMKLSLIKKGKVPLNINLCRKKQKRKILEYENGIFIREYDSAKEAGLFLNINYKLINNVLRGRVKKLNSLPNKTWIYKDGKPTRKIKNVEVGWNKGLYKKVYQYDYNKNLIKFFNSIDEASKELKLSRNTIINNCNNKTKKCIKLKCIFKYE